MNAGIISNEPKTGTFQMRINPEYKKQLEELFAKCGMTLSEATNVFFQMALTTGGLPFNVNSDPKIVLSDRSVAYLKREFRKGLESAKKDGWISEDAMHTKYR
ncbi:addiction module antitoxin RelB/DinJ [methanogenic archaeon ISO4-H5]|jgi:addiction module RelB/DinJ family antitoxin|nr:addiction module antitoxin RelB/DinJ [methanogenic archaeon ISO4-H5]